MAAEAAEAAGAAGLEGKRAKPGGKPATEATTDPGTKEPCETETEWGSGLNSCAVVEWACCTGGSPLKI